MFNGMIQEVIECASES